MDQANHTYFSDSCVYILSSSHNDIAFLDSPLATILFRNQNIIDQAILRMEEDPSFFHSMECVLYLKDYLILHPAMKERLGKVLANGQFGCGATFTQCYETSLSSEALIRQFYLGKRWLKNVFPEVDLRTVWNVDVPSRAKQSAQVMKQCGVDYLFISRMDAGFFHWYSPDGSRVSGYSTGHYHHNSLNQILNLTYDVYEKHDSEQAAKEIHGNLEQGRKDLAEYLDGVAAFYQKRSIPPFSAFLSIRDYDYPLNLTSYMHTLKEGTSLPTFAYSSAERFMDQAMQELDQEAHFNHYHGERPNLWVYHQSTHARAFWYNRNGIRQLEEAERLAASALIKGIPYPQDEIDCAWAELLYLDHGWGGANGHITDETYLQTSRRGFERAQTIHARIRDTLASLICIPEDGSYLTLFNPTFQSKTDTVSCVIDWRQLGSVFFAVQDSQGTSIPYQIVEEPEPYHMRILLPAVVPALGHVRYRIVAGTASLVSNAGTHVTETESLIHIENQFYTLDISRGGITSLFDKELGKQLLPKESALALFEIFVLDSCGNGSGEFSEIQQANNIYGVESRKYWLGSGYTESTGKQNISWRIARNEGLNQCDGDVATIIKGEARFPHFVLQQEFTVHHQVKKISVKVGIEAWDGTMYKEIRINVPYQSEGSSITYEIPLGILSVGEDEVDSAVGTQFYVNDGKTVQYPTPCRKIHPREVQSWIGISHEAHSVFIGCPDTPSFDFDESRGVVQPILLASRHSCLSTGNPYHQRGSHEYSFTLTSMQGDKTSCIQKNSGSGYPISATASYTCKKREGLPLQASALQVTGPIEISTIKKAEDTDDLVMRVFEQYGKQSPFSVVLEGGISAYRKTDMLEYGGEFVSEKCIEDIVEPYTVQTYIMKR